MLAGSNQGGQASGAPTHAGSSLRRRSVLSLAFAAGAMLAIGAPPARADGGTRLSGPFVHDNLAVYFVHGASAPGPVPLTLREAMADGSVRLDETSSVNELSIENLGEREVFVQSGDIVTGGKQDRVLMVSLVLPPRSGRTPIASFCVEQGRWSGRGREDATRFHSAEAAVPSRKAKLAMRAPQPAAAAGVGARQQEVWRDVSAMQQRLSSSVGAPVASPTSATSLQLSLENEKVTAAKARYVAALKDAGTASPDIIGYAFAINGKLNSADIYPSNGLFRKMWDKLLAASATEALGDKSPERAEPPSTDAVLSFLQSAERGTATTRQVTKSARLETREAEHAIYFETARTAGGFVHRNYLAK